MNGKNFAGKKVPSQEKCEKNSSYNSIIADAVSLLKHVYNLALKEVLGILVENCSS